MKRIISIVMSAIIMLSALCLVSCDAEATSIESINGMSAQEVCELGFEKLREKERFNVSADAEIGINVLVATIPVGIDDFYVNTTDGENMHYKFTDEDLLFIDNEQIFSLFSDLDREVWYVDGVRYSVGADGTTSVDKSGKRPANLVGKIIDAVEKADISGAACYEQNGEQYVMINIVLEEFDIGEISCKIFVDENGDVTKAVAEGKLYGVIAKLTMNFTYDGIPAIEIPEDMFALA